MTPPDTGRMTLRPRALLVVYFVALALMTVASLVIITVPVFAHVPLLDFGNWQTYAGITFLWWAAFVTAAALLGAADIETANPHPTRASAPADAVAIMMRAEATPNERAELLKLLVSLAEQSTPPTAVILVENGEYDNGNTQAIFSSWKNHPVSRKIARKKYLYCEVPSKRIALMLASQEVDLDATIVTVDSYTLCAPEAIREIAAVFADPSVMAATGLLVGRRTQRRLLPRAAGQLFMAGFQERAAWSKFGVLSSTRGGFAAYRNQLLRHHSARFLADETVDDGEDRELTGAAIELGGKAVLVPTALASTRHPIKLRDLTTRYCRWGIAYRRGALEMLRHRPMRHAAWWLTAAQLSVHILQGIAYPAALLIEPLITRQPPWQALAFVSALTACRTAPTLAVKHEGQSGFRQVVSFVLLLPPTVLLDIWVSMIQIWGGLFNRRRIEWHSWQAEVPDRTMSVR